jgi:Family of unknown function (DUF5832)
LEINLNIYRPTNQLTKMTKKEKKTKTTTTTTTTTTYVDMLDEDKPIANQKFACLSFVSPEKILKEKSSFLFEEFLKQWEFSKGMNKFMDFLNFIAFKYKLKFNDLNNDFTEFLEEEQQTIRSTTIDDDFKTFVDQNEDKLEKDFNTKHEFQTSVRGLKVRGVYPTKEEAELRCKILRELDPNHDVYVGPVGLWLPWHPEPYKTEKVEYFEEELNQLMYHKKSNEDAAKNEFEKRVKETKQKAIEDNKKKSEKFGTTLTQDIDANGNLVSINNKNTQEELFKSNQVVDVEDIQKELFEGENIVMKKKA